MSSHSTPPPHRHEGTPAREPDAEIEIETEGTSSKPSTTQPNSSSPSALRVAAWMPIIVQIFGLGLIGYEAVLAEPKSATAIAAGLTLAIGGKLSDILRTGGL